MSNSEPAPSLSIYPLNFNLMSFICEWAAQTCFTKSIERKILHYNRSGAHCLIGYSPFSLPRFPSPRKNFVLLKCWASRLALLSPVGREGAVYFFLKICLLPCICIYMRGISGSPSFLYQCIFILILLDIPGQHLRKSVYPFFYVLSQQATHLRYTRNDSTASALRKRILPSKRGEEKGVYLFRQRDGGCLLNF